MKGRGAPPPPSSSAPISQEVVEIVRKKQLAQPAGPPPAGMTNFKGPKQYSPQKFRDRSDSDEVIEIDSDDENKGRSSYSKAPAPSKREPEPDMEAQAKSSNLKRGEGNFKPIDDSMNSKFINDVNEWRHMAPVANSKGYLSFEPVLRYTYRELKNFIMSPCKPNVLVRCYIERNRSGTNMLSPIYSLCADLEDGTGRELIVCRKILQSRSPHYVFSLKSEDLYRKREQRSKLYLGKLRGVSPSEYILYDYGICNTLDHFSDDKDDDDERDDDDNDSPTRQSTDNGNQSTEDKSLYRKELASIYFNSKKRPPPPGVRGTEICIPNVRSGHETECPIVLQQGFQAIREAGKQNVLHHRKYFIMHERTSRYYDYYY